MYSRGTYLGSGIVNVNRLEDGGTIVGDLHVTTRALQDFVHSLPRPEAEYDQAGTKGEGKLTRTTPVSNGTYSKASQAPPDQECDANRIALLQSEVG